MEKTINVVTVLLLALLGIAGFMVMYHTTESNVVTADIAKIQSKHKKRVIQEVALLTAEIKNLEKDIANIGKILEDMKENEKNKNSR